MLHGPDVSDWQGEVDWQAVRDSGRRFGFTKATDGTGFQAETLERNRNGMAEAAMALIGLYHYALPQNGEPDAEADHFVRTIGGLRDREVPVLDIEVGDVATWEAWSERWLGIVEDATGRRPLIYVSASPADQAGFAGLTEYPLWVAAYGRDDGEVPDFGTFTAGAWPRWTFWQYSSKVEVPGIAGPADDNVFDGDEEELAALAGAPLHTRTNGKGPKGPRRSLKLLLTHGGEMECVIGRERPGSQLHTLDLTICEASRQTEAAEFRNTIYVTRANRGADKQVAFKVFGPDAVSDLVVSGGQTTSIGVSASGAYAVQSQDPTEKLVVEYWERVLPLG